MSLDAAVLRAPQAAHDPFSSTLAADPAAGIVKHAVRIWAREQGVAEDEISGLTQKVVEFAGSMICEHKVRAVV